MSCKNPAGLARYQTSAAVFTSRPAALEPVQAAVPTLGAGPLILVLRQTDVGLGGRLLGGLGHQKVLLAGQRRHEPDLGGLVQLDHRPGAQALLLSTPAGGAVRN